MERAMFMNYRKGVFLEWLQ